MAIKRIWHGWTTPENADAYEKVVQVIVAPAIAAEGIEGYGGLELLRRADMLPSSPEGTDGNDVEFVTIMTFDSLHNIIAFLGDDYSRAHVPEAAQKVLKRWDSRAVHFDVRGLL